jgi:carboxypeptidase Q
MRIFQEIREHNHLLENIEYLSDAIGPRLTGSEQMRTAESWAASLAGQYGLENPHLEAWRIAHSWQRGSAQAQIIKPIRRKMTIASAGWSPATRGTVRGNVVYVAATNPDELHTYRGKLKGSIVFYEKPAELMSQEPVSGPFTGPQIQTPGPPTKGASSEEEQFNKARNAFFKDEGAAVVLLDSGKHDGLLSISNVAHDYDIDGTLPTAMLTHED